MLGMKCGCSNRSNNHNHRCHSRNNANLLVLRLPELFLPGFLGLDALLFGLPGGFLLLPEEALPLQLGFQLFKLLCSPIPAMPGKILAVVEIAQ